MNKKLRLDVHAEVLESSFGRHWLLVNKLWNMRDCLISVQTAGQLQIAIRQERELGCYPTVVINYGNRQ